MSSEYLLSRSRATASSERCQGFGWSEKAKKNTPTVNLARALIQLSFKPIGAKRIEKTVLDESIKIERERAIVGTRVRQEREK